MKQTQHPSKPSMSDKTKITIVLAFMGIGVLLLILLGAFALRGNLPIPAAFLPATETQAVPTIFVPTPDCGSPTLVIGPNTFQIQAISPAPDGTVPVPAGVNGIAYQVEGDGQASTFLLSSTPENVALLAGLPEGTTAKATGANCNSATFTLFASQAGSFNPAPQTFSVTPGIMIFVQTDAAGNGLMATGDQTEEQIAVFNTPDTSGVELLAEVGLQEVKPDGNTVQLTVSIYNFGGTPITVTANDVSLTQPDGISLVMENSSPGLPGTIQTAETKEFTFTFPRPTTPTTTLKVFTVEYDIEGY